MSTILYADQGADFSFEMDLSDPNEFPVDVTGYAFAGSARKVYSETVAFTFTISIVDGDTLRVSLSDSTTSAVKPGKYAYDIMMTDTDGFKSKILEGILYILESSTRT